MALPSRVLCGALLAATTTSASPAETRDGCLKPLQHVIFHDSALWLEGLGAKWQFVKPAIWVALRWNQLLRNRCGNATVAWLPNPAELMNPHSPRRSMLGALGLQQPTAPWPVLPGRKPSWLHELVESGAYKRVDLTMGRHATERSEELERQAVEEMAAAEVPIAFYVDGPPFAMHWHGSLGAWLHWAFFSHRLARAARTSHSGDLQLPPGVEKGRYLVSVHIRHFDIEGYSLPGSYFIAALSSGGLLHRCGRGHGGVCADWSEPQRGPQLEHQPVPQQEPQHEPPVLQQVFASTPLSCDNSAVLVFGEAKVPEVSDILRAFPCARLIEHGEHEPEDDEAGTEEAEDDYESQDDEDDGHRGYVFRDLELMGLSDVLVASNSEFSFLAQGLSAPDTITLCPPLRRGEHNGPKTPCDKVGVPLSVLTHPRNWGVVTSSALADVDSEHVTREVKRCWEQRVLGGVGPIWSRKDHGIVKFNFGAEVEGQWKSQFEYSQLAPATPTEESLPVHVEDL